MKTSKILSIIEWVLFLIAAVLLSIYVRSGIVEVIIILLILLANTAGKMKENVKLREDAE